VPLIPLLLAGRLRGPFPASLTNRGRKNSLCSAGFKSHFSSEPLPERLQSLEI
jgi:hypothetical protein